MNRRICFCQKGTLQQCILHSGRRLLQTSLRPLRTFLRHHSGPLCCILWSLPEFWKEAKHSLLQEEPSGPALSSAQLQGQKLREAKRWFRYPAAALQAGLPFLYHELYTHQSLQLSHFYLCEDSLLGISFPSWELVIEDPPCLFALPVFSFPSQITDYSTPSLDASSDAGWSGEKVTYAFLPVAVLSTFTFITLTSYIFSIASFIDLFVALSSTRKTSLFCFSIIEKVFSVT